MKKAKVVIFDMDGVITDTQDIIANVESELLREYGINITADKITEKYAGTSSKEMLPDVFSYFGKEIPELEILVNQRVERIDAAVRGKVKAIPGTLEFIRKLQMLQIPLAVASGSRTHFIKNVLSELDIFNAFNNVTGSDEVLRGKPEPDVFLLAAKRLGVEPESCLVIEDGVNGMIAADRAGMKCIGLVRTGEHSKNTYPADFLVRNLVDINIEEWLDI